MQGFMDAKDLWKLLALGGVTNYHINCNKGEDNQFCLGI
jgi:hypothetical protein